MLVGSVAALVALGAAGCGGGGRPAGAGSGSFTLAATRSCLRTAGYGATALANRSLPGSGGNLRVQLAHRTQLLNPAAVRGTVVPDEFVFLVFDRTAAQALATEQKAITLTVKTLNAGGIQVTRSYVRSGVGLRGNVFYYSPSGPLTKQQRTKIESCLR